MSLGCGLEGSMLRIRLHAGMEDERVFSREDSHEARRLCDSLCNRNLSGGSEKSANEGGFGEHGGNCDCSCFVLLDGV